MVNSDLSTAVDPVRPVAPYIGGKRRLAERLVGLIAAVPHRTYAEPFVGMGGVFFRRRAAPPAEVINDRNGEVANLFRILQRHYPQFMETLRFQITSRREFERLKASDPATLTDLERAGRFLYLQRTAFGGKVAGQNFGVDPRAAGGFNLTRLVPSSCGATTARRRCSISIRPIGDRRATMARACSTATSSSVWRRL